MRAPANACYSDAGIEAARRVVSAAAGVDAAAVFAVVARLRQTDPGKMWFSVTAFAALGWSQAEFAERLREATASFRHAFVMDLVKVRNRADADSFDDGEGQEIKVAAALLEVLDKNPTCPVDVQALLDMDATTWAAIAVAAATSGGGHHLALRCTEDDRYTALDFAGLLAAAGARVIVWPPHERLATAMLSAELHGGDGTIVVADGSHLVSALQEDDDYEFGAAAHFGRLALGPAAAALLPSLEAARTTYIWRIPERGVLPPKVRRLIAACFGPLRQDPSWRAAHLKDLLPGLDSNGVRALLADCGDVRDAGAMARLAAAVAHSDIGGAASVAEAVALIAGKSPRGAASSATEAAFDEMLLACDAEGRQLLERGRMLAQGGRVLVYGPPGGGKSSFARVLAARIADHQGGAPPTMVEPASILARAWGATERLLAGFFAQAHRSAAVVVADEFDSMAGVRESDAPASGNALLIRTLTNEWLRLIDAYPGVPLIVTVNDLRTLDPAIRRRFSIALEVRGELLDAQEYRAWETILKMKPPRGWSPCGASISDYVAAAGRCRLLGQDDAPSHATALVRARALRLGHPTKTGRPSRKGPLN